MKSFTLILKTIFVLCLFFGTTSIQGQQWETITNSSNIYYNRGNVGIGTSTPVSKLNVKGGVVAESSTYPYGININESASGRVAREFSISYNNTGKLFALGAIFNQSELEIGYIGGVYQTNGTMYPWMSFKGGNVGIGINNPLSARLNLACPRESEVIKINFTGTLNTLIVRNEINKAYDPAFSIINVNGDNINNGFIRFHTGGSNAGGFLSLGSSGLERLRVAANGNIGIGTASPERTLDVVGIVRAHTVQVNATKTADFVFADDYNLKPLKEVEQFIVENRHLPEVASADSMIQNGIDMGEMQIMLLQKVEELTLYLIEQEKRITEQNQKIAEQDQHNKQLEVRIKELENR